MTADQIPPPHPRYNDESVTPGPRAWAQQSGETDTAYRAFLVYRNLGPKRTVKLAFHAWMEAKGDGGAVDSRQYVPARWQGWSARHSWQVRAQRWDISELIQSGTRVPLMLNIVIERAAVRLLDAMTNDGVRPQTWDDVIKTITLLTNIVDSSRVDKLEAEAVASGDYSDGQE